MVTNLVMFMLLTLAPIQQTSGGIDGEWQLLHKNIGEPIIPQQTSGGIHGQWKLLHKNIGTSPMHMQLLHNDKVVMFDRTDFGPSNISLPFNHCRYDPFDSVLQKDCTAHSILYDIRANTFRPLSIRTDTWCSSGSVLPNGTLVQTGGYNDGDHTVRTILPCDDGTCDWAEFPGYLKERRWFSTDQLLPDGRIIIVGGKRQFNYEFYPTNSPDFFTSSLNSSSFLIDFLRHTTDGVSENNLYPFVHLLPDGNLFIFANVWSVVFNYKQNKVIKRLPPITGDDPRNYPSSGSSVLLPLDENKLVEAQVMVCGGAPRDAFLNIKTAHSFARAIPTCGRIKVTDEKPSWEMETMPIARVMGDMVILPNGDVLIINGAGSGTAGWENARDPVTRPVIYHPNGPQNARFSVMQSTTRPRLYNSAAILVTDGRILVGGSNPHMFYNFTNVEFPTELSLEAFLPPYLAREYDPLRPEIVNTIGVVGPSTAEIAPPGYYLLYLVHAGIPSPGMWVKVQ